MLVYITLLTLTTWMAITHMRPQTVPADRHLGWPWSAFFVLLTLVIGFRFQVGGDWDAYLFHIEDLKGEPLNTVVGYGDLAYQLLNWLGANVGGGVYFVNLVCGALFCLGLATFCRNQPRPWLAVLVALPYLVMVVAMGYSRQGVAIGLAMLAITNLQTGSASRFLLWIVLAALFHKSVVILIPLAAFATSRYRVLTFIGLMVSSAVLYILLLQEQLQYLVSGYIEAEYASSGAAIRVAMNAIPAALFLIFKSRFVLDSKTRGFWIWMAWGALLFIVILMITPSSTAVDRISLYWIPLQLLIFSRLPDSFGVAGHRNPFWVTLVAAYSSTTMLGWLLFADNANSWLPYRFYPWVAMW